MDIRKALATVEPFGFTARKAKTRDGFLLAPFVVMDFGRLIGPDCTFVSSIGDIEPIIHEPGARVAAVALAQELEK